MHSRVDQMHQDIFVNILLGWALIVFACACWLNRNPL